MLNEFRKDPLSGDWILLAPARAHKTDNQGKVAFTAGNCPFDDPQKSGQETPVAIYSHGKKVASPEDWTIQVLPNKYPAVVAGQCGPVMEQGMFSVAAGVGSHELVITRDHDKHFAQFTDEEMTEVINAYRDRYQALAADTCNVAITIFHNHGRLGGASIYHNHSQILSTPIVPPQLSGMFARCDDYFKKTGKRLAGELLDEELKSSKRIVFQNQHFVAFCPYTSRSAYEVNIFSKNGQPDFGALTDEEVPALAEVMREIFARLDKALDNPDYMYFIHTAPPRDKDTALDWHIEIMPRFSPAAGFELGTGIFINSVDPDQAAETLRNAI